MDPADAAAHAHVAAPTSTPTTSRVGAFTAQEARQARRLGLVIALVVGFFLLELGGALLADSVVLQADALHLLMDIVALGVSLLAMRLAVRRPTARFTYGLRRTEPVAAIFSAFLVLGTSAVIVVEGLEALHGHEPPKAGIMLMVATMALLVHGVSAWLLHDVVGHGHVSPHVHGEHDHGEHGPHDHDHHGHGGHALNLRGAWLHLAADALGAVAALVAALVIRFGGSPAADPIASFLVAAILVVGAVQLVRDATLVLLEAAPPHLPLEKVRAAIAGAPGVLAVRELHVWTLGAGHDAITVHVQTESADPVFGQRLSRRLRSQLGAEYVTVQVEALAARAEEP